MEYSIDAMKSSGWEQVKNIYLEGIKTGIETFQTEAPTWKSWDKGHLNTCSIIQVLFYEI